MQNTVALAVISRHLPGDAAREEELAFRRILHELLAAGSELLSVSLPAPLVTIVNEYCQGRTAGRLLLFLSALFQPATPWCPSFSLLPLWFGTSLFLPSVLPSTFAFACVRSCLSLCARVGCGICRFVIRALYPLLYPLTFQKRVPSVRLLPIHFFPPPISFTLSAGLKWKLATGAPGINGAIERISDTSARHSGPKYQRNAFIQGDTPLSSGRHAWRVRVEGLGDYGGEVALGIVQAGREVRKHASSPCFHGIETYGVGRRWGPRSGGPLEVARYTMDSGLGEIRSGDTVDLPLDMDKRSLTAITLKDGKRCVWRGLPDMAWVPHFYLCNANNAISVEVIDPEQAGLMAKKD